MRKRNQSTLYYFTMLADTDAGLQTKIGSNHDHHNRRGRYIHNMCTMYIFRTFNFSQVKCCTTTLLAFPHTQHFLLRILPFKSATYTLH